ncbi:hypothetical protein RRG43_01480 [Mycoplasmopsis cynos]|uniref:hypothetical protein n=1 Tax=Mycoplasmopsis cynos TaxID=171284 RepID=UPI002AFE164F|nr:hypothetical protein [Mycoplasmopsis cynos]WQQ15748.1 hypothetical protein RRG43_01480 [Mycoplasmopsis cynos]
MKKFYSRYRNKILLSVGAIVGISVLCAIAVTKITTKFKPSFFNYKSYMSEQNINKINETFDYKEFDEINEFSNALINNKAAAGIGSEFLAAELVKKHLIGKIDYSVLLNLPELSGYLEYDSLNEKIKQNKFTNEQEKAKIIAKFNIVKQKKIKIKQLVKLSLRKEIWNHINKYKLQNNDELWEYFYPYFSQDMVIAYNIKKVPLKKSNNYGAIDFSKYKNKFKNNDIKDPLAIINVLKILSENNYDKWYITDAIRDNLLYGSAYWPLPNSRTEKNFTGNVSNADDNNNQVYKILIDSFADLIKDGTGYEIKDNKHITFKGDGLEIVNDLINPARPDVNASILYNGDAIDAYYGSDNFPNVVGDGEIRGIKPKQNILLLDGYVVSSGLAKENASKYTKTVSQSIFSGSLDIIQSYKELRSKGLVNDILNIKDDSKFELIQQRVSQAQIAKNWEFMKNNQIQQLLANSKQKYQTNKVSNLIEKYKKMIDLSNKGNTEKFNNYYKIQLDYEAGKEVEFEKRISFIPIIFNEYLRNNFSDFIDEISQLIKNEKYEFGAKLTNSLEKRIFTQYILNDQTDLKTKINELKNRSKDSFNSDLKSLIYSYLSYKLAYLDLSNETNKSKYNFSNFDFVNYDPTNIADYEQVLQNYFLDPINGYDKNAIYLYEISNTNGVIHENIQPVSDELQSKITTYYFNKTKS